jgi:hypothetical protein
MARAYNEAAMVILNGHFDGKRIVVDEPVNLPLPSGTRLKISVEAVDDVSTVTRARQAFEPLKIRIHPDVSNAIALEDEYNIEES